MKTVILFLFFFNSLTLYAQDSSRLTLGEKSALRQLKQVFSDSAAFNVIDNKTVLLKDTLTVITMAEAILFNIYKKENIIRQRPYEIYHVNNYWIITGTLPKNTWGGTFYIAIDDRNGKIVRLLHGR